VKVVGSVSCVVKHRLNHPELMRILIPTLFWDDDEDERLLALGRAFGEHVTPREARNPEIVSMSDLEAASFTSVYRRI
jgi:hypothetical protein